MAAVKLLPKVSSASAIPEVPMKTETFTIRQERQTDTKWRCEGLFILYGYTCFGGVWEYSKSVAQPDGTWKHYPWDGTPEPPGNNFKRLT